MATDCAVSPMNLIQPDGYALTYCETHFQQDSFAPTAAYAFSGSDSDFGINLQASISFPAGNQPATSLGPRTLSNISDLSVCSNVFEHDFEPYRDIHDETSAIPVDDLFLEAVGLSWTTSSTSTAASPRSSEWEEAIARGALKPPSEWRPSSPTPVNQQEHMQLRKLQRKRSPKLSRRNSSEVDVKAKAAHSAVERRYRDKLNDKIMLLHRTLCSSELMAHLLPGSLEPDDLSQLAGKLGKAEIMTNAINYVNRAELQFQLMSDEIVRLRNGSLQLETLVGRESQPFRNQVSVPC